MIYNLKAITIGLVLVFLLALATIAATHFLARLL